MLKAASGIASCLGLAVVASALVPGSEAAQAMGAFAPLATGGAFFAGGLAINFGHELCKRFSERALVYKEKVWGLDKNEHIARGVRRAQVAATRELLRVWRRNLPAHDAANDDYSYALGRLLAKWCDEQERDAAVERWADFHGDGAQDKVLRRAFETAFGTQIDDRASMADRARQARELAVNEAFDDAIEGALARAQQDRASAIRKSGAFVSFGQAFFKEPSQEDGWFNYFLVAIGREFKAKQEFKALWDSVQIGAISAMVLDDIELSAERHDQITHLIKSQSGRLESLVVAIKADTEAILAKQDEIQGLLQQLLAGRAAQAGPSVAPAIREAIVAAEVGAAQGDERLERALDLLKANEVSEAEKLFRMIAEEKAARISKDRKDAAAAYRNLGAIAGLADPKRALDAYLKAVEFDPDDADSLIWIGFIQIERGNLNEAQSRLARVGSLANGEDRVWYRYWSFLGLGDVQVAQGNLPDALKSFRDGLAIRDRLAQSDPGNAGWQRDLSVSYDRVGDVQVAQGNLPDALKSFRDGLAIADRLAQSDPGNAGWQRDLSVSHAKLADVYLKLKQAAQAQAALASGRLIIARLVAQFPEWAEWKKDLAWFDQQIAALKS
jgi:tetratricopeptide (TPR) repeat protein